MFEIGTFNKLKAAKIVDFGVYLTQDLTDERVLLPKKEMPEGLKIGDEVTVFLYRDSEDRLIATTKTPDLMMGKTAVLTVAAQSSIGAFLSWGLPKDLFLPYKEMTRKVTEGDRILVRLYVDKSGRLCASMKKLYPLLKTNSPYRVGDQVEGRIYEFGHDFGTFVAVDDCYSGMIPSHEDVSSYRIGDLVKVRVTNVKEDGKLDLSLRKEAWEELDRDGEMLLSILDSYAGVLPFTEKADPAVIKRETGLSKNAFKRAVGHLYKERKITIKDGVIKKV